MTRGAIAGAFGACGFGVEMPRFNVMGVGAVGGVQSCVAVMKATGLLWVVGGGFVLGGDAPASPALFSSSPSLGMFGLAMVFVLLTYGGWNEAAYISTEVRGGKRAIVPVIVISIVILTLIYILFNIAVLAGLGLSGLAGSKAVAADLMGKAFGPWGGEMLGIFLGGFCLRGL